MSKETRVQDFFETWSGLLIAIFSVGTVAIIALIVWLGPKARDAGPEIGVYSSTGERSSKYPDVVSIFQLWTPNMSTKRDILKKMDIKQSDIKMSEIPQWYWASDIENGKILESEVEIFLEKIRMLKPVGVNITPVLGVGTSDLKRGYLWKITVSRENPISRNDLLSLYKGHWKREDQIWIEQNTARATRTK